MSAVAKMVGVSTQTVSRYFTGTGYVGLETRKRIAAAVEELAFVPNQSARALRTRRTNSIGVLSLGEFSYGSSGVLTGLGIAARETGTALNITALDLGFGANNWEAETIPALDHFRSLQVDGVVLMQPLPEAAQVLDNWDPSIPMVTVFGHSPAQGASTGTDSYGAGLIATQHLIERGHRNILHIAGPSSRYEANERKRGYHEAMRSAGLSPHILAATDWSAESGYRAGKRSDPADFTAVFTSNDEIALGFMSAMEQRGARAPKDFSIIGIDDMPSAAYYSPPLTTLHLDFRALGIATLKMLHLQILTGRQPGHLAIEPKLIVRGSTTHFGNTKPAK